jgi:alkylated DNA repair protein (DNA oxidative demethylase)
LAANTSINFGSLGDVVGISAHLGLRLVNFYQSDARMGMHQDCDEADLKQPVISISLRDEALFQIGQMTKGGKTDSIWLRSGDVLRLGGNSRLIYHGIDRINSGSSPLLKYGGRINFTLRVVS